MRKKRLSGLGSFARASKKLININIDIDVNTIIDMFARVGRYSNK